MSPASPAAPPSAKDDNPLDTSLLADLAKRELVDALYSVRVPLWNPAACMQRRC